MRIQDDEPLSPTVEKILNAFLDALKSDVDIDDDVACRLDALLRSEKKPTSEQIGDILFNQSDKEKPS